MPHLKSFSGIILRDIIPKQVAVAVHPSPLRESEGGICYCNLKDIHLITEPEQQRVVTHPHRTNTLLPACLMDIRSRMSRSDICLQQLL